MRSIAKPGETGPRVPFFEHRTSKTIPHHAWTRLAAAPGQFVPSPPPAALGSTCERVGFLFPAISVDPPPRALPCAEIGRCFAPVTAASGAPAETCLSGIIQAIVFTTLDMRSLTAWQAPAVSWGGIFRTRFNPHTRGSDASDGARSPVILFPYLRRALPQKHPRETTIFRKLFPNEGHELGRRYDGIHQKQHGALCPP